MRVVRLRLWHVTLLASLFYGSFWIAIHALWKLQQAGQGVWSIIWPGLLFAVLMAAIDYINRRRHVV